MDEAKNRLHPDLKPIEDTREQALERLLGLEPSRSPTAVVRDGSGWAVLANPEGNDFLHPVLRRRAR